MTKLQKNSKSTSSVSDLATFHLEADRNVKGLSVLIGGIIAISDLSASCVSLASHGGRIIISGERLAVKVYEFNSVEIVGKIKEVSFVYGKN